MGVKRYYADADTTITNAYKQNLTTKATGSNMGAADTLETFFVHGHAFTGSTETSRILIKFPTHDISADRTAGRIPAADSVDFYLRMYNAEHALPLPKDFTMSIRPVTTQWQEGNGIDMEEYKDLTHDLYEGANWDVAMSGSTAGTGVAATATVTVKNEGWMEAGDKISLISTDGTTVECTIVAAGGSTTSSEATTAVTAAIATNSTTNTATNIATAINHSTYFSATSEAAVVTITQASAGDPGNTAITLTDLGGGTGMEKTDFSGGGGVAPWTTEGGDYETDSHAKSQTLTFPKGTEDLELNITALVEEWVAGSRSNYGVGVHMTGSYETGTRSYYTKKFFARSSEYFFKRPVIEARWDSTEKDERGSFYAKSDLLSSTNNTNTIYFKNYFNGVLTAINGTPSLRANIYSDSNKSYQITNEAGTTYHAADSTGVYKDDVIVDTSLSEVYVEWVDSSGTIYHKETITVKQYAAQTTYKTSEYTLSITNLRASYSNKETSRVRLFARQKEWNPNIYTVASKTPENLIIEDIYYNIYRVIDELEVVSYGTGSATNAAPQAVGQAASYTRLSYDTSGNYFDLDMSLFEPGYSYGIKFAIYHDGYYHEQVETFKFRVEK